MLRTLGAVIAGFLAWWVAASLISRGIKIAWPDYGAAEPAMHFTPAMLAARLAMGAAATVIAGWTTHRIAKGARKAPLGLGFLLLVFFIPVHIKLFATFPIWYHLVFLGSLVPLAMLAGLLAGRRV